MKKFKQRALAATLNASLEHRQAKYRFDELFLAFTGRRISDSERDFWNASGGRATVQEVLSHSLAPELDKKPQIKQAPGSIRRAEKAGRDLVEIRSQVYAPVQCKVVDQVCLRHIAYTYPEHFILGKNFWTYDWLATLLSELLRLTPWLETSKIAEVVQDGLHATDEERKQAILKLAMYREYGRDPDNSEHW